MYNAYSSSYKVAAINGDFFNIGDTNAPQGDFVRHGVKYQYNDSTTDSLKGHTVMRIFNWNGSRHPVTFSGSTQSGMNDTYPNLAIGGTNLMVKSGASWLYSNPSSSVSGWRGSLSVLRSAACITSDTNTLYLVVSTSAVTAAGLTGAFNNLGCTRGMEFDGGGSSTLIHNGQLKYTGAGSPGRAIANGLLVLYNPFMLVAPDDVSGDNPGVAIEPPSP